MNRQNWSKQPLCLGLALFLLLFLAACKGQTDEQNSTQSTPSTQPTAAPAPLPPPIPYTDLSEDSPYYDAIVWAYQNGIASDGETFGPADTCTRGQVITFLWRAMGSPEPWIMENPFDDASHDDWYYKPALWAYQHNIATSTTVNPNNPCTSAEALTFLWRTEGQPDKLNTLAVSSTYYGQPAAWADKNGLLAGTEFDPASPCTRADLMAYLYWAAEQWTPSEEEQRIQTEYDKILYGSENTPDYADYVDVDGDGKVELLTLQRRYNNQWEIAVAVYADMDGQIEKSCEGIFRVVEYGQNTPVDTFLTDGGVFSLYTSDGQLYLCQNRSFYEPAWNPQDDDLYDFYKIEKGAITFSEQRNIWTLYDRETGEEQKGDTGTSRVYTKQKDIFRLDNQYSGSVLDVGILPTDWQECRRYWTAYWEAVDPTIYAAVLSGDFSAFAGNYEGEFYDEGEYNGKASVAINKDGTATGDLHAESILLITVSESGKIDVVTEYYEDVDTSFGYTIYPSGYAVDWPENDPSKVRIEWMLNTSGYIAFLTKSS